MYHCLWAFPIPTAQLTMDGPTSCSSAPCWLLTSALRGTIVASQLRHLQEVRETLAAVDWLATLPVESKVVKSLQLRHPAFYQKLCSHGVVPQETDSFHDWHLHPRSPLDLGFSSSPSSMAAQERLSVCEQK